jgi:hypothetical protein
VAVEVDRGGDLAVSELLRDDLRVHALAEEQRGGGVAQVVEADARQPGAGEQRFEAAAHEVAPVDVIRSIPWLLVGARTLAGSSLSGMKATCRSF